MDAIKDFLKKIEGILAVIADFVEKILRIELKDEELDFDGMISDVNAAL